MCLFNKLLNLNVISHFGHFSSTLAGFECLIMCLVNFEGFVATKSHRVQFKLFWSSADGNSPMWPSLVFTTFSLTLWVDSMCFSKYASLFNVLSQRLHWIVHLFLSTCSFKFPAVLNTAGHFSHWWAFLSPTHFVTWLLLLLYGILFSQCTAVFACNFSVRLHVSLQLPSSNAGLLTFLTCEDTIIMLWFDMHSQMFFRRSFKVTNGTRRHVDCKFVLPIKLLISDMMIFP